MIPVIRFPPTQKGAYQLPSQKTLRVTVAHKSFQHISLLTNEKWLTYKTKVNLFFSSKNLTTNADTSQRIIYPLRKIVAETIITFLEKFSLVLKQQQTFAASALAFFFLFFWKKAYQNQLVTGQNWLQWFGVSLEETEAQVNLLVWIESENRQNENETNEEQVSSSANCNPHEGVFSLSNKNQNPNKRLGQKGQVLRCARQGMGEGWNHGLLQHYFAPILWQRSNNWPPVCLFPTIKRGGRAPIFVCSQSEQWRPRNTQWGRSSASIAA